MLNYDIIRFAGVLSILVGVTTCICAMLVPNKRGPLALGMVLVGGALIACGVIRDRNGLPLTQAFLYQHVVVR